MAETKNFFNLTLSELKQMLMDRGKEKFRAEQLFSWVYGKGVTDFSQMSNLSKSFKEKLPLLLNFDIPKIETIKKSSDGTQKILFDVGEGLGIEAVLIPAPGRFTLCVSSEVGCSFDCKFCFTAKQKLKRRLTTNEIIGQYIHALHLLKKNERISNIVFMGMGEPLDNSDAVFKALDILQSSNGINLSRKKITISTSGLVPLIPFVTEAGVRLAVSLNSVNDEIRSKIMPVNKRWPIAELLEACRIHTEKSKDKVTIEYILLKGVTDSLDDARKLCHLTKKIPCKINIIPFNEHPNVEFSRPSNSDVDSFQREMMRMGVYTLRRKTMGSDIYAACGQLNSVF